MSGFPEEDESLSTLTPSHIAKCGWKVVNHYCSSYWTEIYFFALYTYLTHHVKFSVPCTPSVGPGQRNAKQGPLSYPP